MFLRIVRAAGGQGVKHEYVRVVEAYRDHGKTRHRTILNLGRKDLLAAHLDLAKLTRLLHGEAAPERAIRSEDVHAVAAWDWGAMLAARHLWCELGLEATLDRLAGGGHRDGPTLSDRVLVLIANRLAAPSSEHGLARWLETDFVCDRCGRRFMPAWRDDAERQAGRTPRVRVAARQLQQWYRSLDQLLAHKAQNTAMATSSAAIAAAAAKCSITSRARPGRGSNASPASPPARRRRRRRRRFRK
jgi:hypothetical protein